MLCVLWSATIIYSAICILVQQLLGHPQPTHQRVVPIAMSFSSLFCRIYASSLLHKRRAASPSSIHPLYTRHCTTTPPPLGVSPRRLVMVCFGISEINLILEMANANTRELIVDANGVMGDVDLTYNVKQLRTGKTYEPTPTP